MTIQPYQVLYNERKMKISSDLTLEQHFSLLHKQYLDSCAAAADPIEVIANIEGCREKVYNLFLFSTNETLEEIATSSLKFLLLDYYLAKTNTHIVDLRKRHSFLQSALTAFQSFLETCSRLRILEEDEIAEIENEQAGQATREQKIMRYKRQKEVDSKMKKLQELLHANRSSEQSGDAEDQWREFYLLQLQASARESMDEIRSIKQELPLLLHMGDLRELDELAQNSKASSSASSHGAVTSSPGQPGRLSEEYLASIGLPAPDLYRLPEESRGIEVTRTEKIGDRLVMSRDVVKAAVFQPRMHGPTMSLEEFGDLQVEEMRAREAAAAEAERLRRSGADGAPVRRYNQLELDGDEDDLRLVDKATVADREWDGWKEENPRGSGNKLGKRF